MWTSNIGGWTAISLPLAFIYSLILLYRYATNLWTGTPKFDPYVAASLHNQLVSKIPTETLEEHNAAIVHNWFTAYGKEARAVRGRLSKNLIKFLENVDVPINGGESWTTVGIVPHLALSTPSDLWLPGGGMNWDGSEHADEDWVVLYRDNISLQVDLYFDININLVTYQEEFMPWNENWYPLERILRMWNDMYDTGKFMSSLNNDSFSDGMNPWDIRPYTPSDFDVNLAAWNEYLEAIASRCPSCGVGKPGLIERETVNKFQIGGFLRDFLLNAKRPNFSFIAPGLQIPTSEYLASLLTADQHSPRWHLVRKEWLVPDPDHVDDERNKYGYDFTQEPLPLFIGPNITSRSKYFWWEDRYVLGGLSGLYSRPEEWFADSVSLILPAPVGPDGFLSQSVAQYIENRPAHEGWDSRHAVLANNHVFRHDDICPFTADMWHNPRLFTILRAWKRMVDDGVWKVGPDGIEGGIEKFQDAGAGGWKSKYYKLGACYDEA